MNDIENLAGKVLTEISIFIIILQTWHAKAHFTNHLNYIHLENA